MTVAEAFAIAAQHHQAGRLAEAEGIYRQILAVAPQHADSLHLLGVLAHQVGRSVIAVDLMQKAIHENPNSAEYYSNLGEAYRISGRQEEAIAAYRNAIRLKPDLADAHGNLGIVISEQGHLEEAVVAYRTAIRLRPDYAEGHGNLGNALKDQGHLEEALAAYRTAIGFKPDYAAAYSNLGNALAARGELDEALAAHRTAIRLQPGMAEAHCNFGNALKEQGLMDEAFAAYRTAIGLKPDFAMAFNNMGNAFKEQGEMEEAIAAYRSAIGLRPDLAEFRSNLLFALHYVPEFEGEEMFREHVGWEEVHARPLAEFIVPSGRDRDPERRLRIGYVSPDFREHPVPFFLEGLLAAHDHAQFEVYCYADLVREDGVTERLRQHAAHWRGVTGLRDERVAEMIRRDGIDILVDLAGHTANNRLLVFARKPAPVQVTWLGYPDTTATTTMDYRLTDVQADPPGDTEQWHTEQLVRLPDSAWCYRPADDSPVVNAAPCVQTGCVTFGCFNAQQKINAPLLALWAGILRRVPGSRLLLKNRSLGNVSVQARMRALLEEAGIAPERVELAAPFADTAGHLAAYGRVDIALDTFPYHGTTTTCEALWMGVPVVTLAGKTHASRVGVSLMKTIGLPELVAETVEDYVRIGADLAADVARLTELRATLRERMQVSPLMDAPRFARNVEHAYREMWRAWCAKRCSSPTP